MKGKKSFFCNVFRKSPKQSLNADALDVINTVIDMKVKKNDILRVSNVEGVKLYKEIPV